MAKKTARSSRKPSAAKRGAKSKKQAAEDREVMVARTKMAVGITGLVAFALAFTFGLHTLHARAGEILRPTLPVIDIRWGVFESGDQQTTFLPRSERERLLRRAEQAFARASGGEEGGLSEGALSARPLRAISSALGGTGWFEADPRVSRSGDGTVVVDGAWRQPSAVVRWGRRDHVVSSNAEVLPLVYGEDQARELLRVIQNPPSAPPRDRDGGLANGVVWPTGVQEAIGLIELLASQPAVFEQVYGVDLVSFTRHGTLRILTVHGTWINWGRPVNDGRPAPGEISDERKMARLLNRLAETDGRIDAGRATSDIAGAFDEVGGAGVDGR